MTADAKVCAIIAWLLPLLQRHRQLGTPFVVGLSGVQGSGKSTLVRLLQQELVRAGVRTAQLSLDDLYLTRRDQQKLIDRHPENPLLGSRGQFGTHDLKLARKVFDELGVAGDSDTGQSDSAAFASLPSYDKSAHDGLGDRAAPSTWSRVTLPIDCLILEGWGVGFRALGPVGVESCWRESRNEMAARQNASELARQELRHVVEVDRALAEYEGFFLGPHKHLQALVVLKPQRMRDVYEWRLEQEHQLRLTKSGMTDEQVKIFVDRYYPSYELYFDKMCEGFFDEVGDSGRQINLTIDRQRHLVGIDQR